jgi:nudix-type nucleoside diphosphatase (YffH/AdpP family)
MRCRAALARRLARPALHCPAPPDRKLTMAATPVSSEAGLYPHGLVSLTAAAHPACTGPAILARLSTPVAGPLPASGSAFVAPLALAYTLDGSPKRWDMVRSHASVGVLLYHASRQAALIVRQFRPAVWESARAEEGEEEVRSVDGAGGEAPSPPPLSSGLAYELCAGILDKPGLSPAAVAAEEVAEECGFRVDPTALEVVGTYRTAIGITGARHTIFYAAVSDADALPLGPGVGGGVDGEAIETLALPLASFDAFMDDPALSRSAGLMFGLAWLKDRLRQRG